MLAFLLAYVMMILFFHLALRITKRLDRYRLKYGFDREIEKKDMNNPTEHRLDEVEKRFKKRVFKD